jgi:hypothetical protein
MSKALVSLTLLTFIFSSQAFSAEKNHPCKNIRSACEAAGFTKGAHKEKKGLVLDCLKPIMAGTAVEGVSINPSDIGECKKMQEKREKRKVKKK